MLEDTRADRAREPLRIMVSVAILRRALARILFHRYSSCSRVREHSPYRVTLNLVWLLEKLVGRALVNKIRVTKDSKGVVWKVVSST